MPAFKELIIPNDHREMSISPTLQMRTQEARDTEYFAKGQRLKAKDIVGQEVNPALLDSQDWSMPLLPIRNVE